MTALAITPEDRRLWTVAGISAFMVHAAAAALVVGWAHPSQPTVPEPVVLVELPPETAAAPATTPTVAPQQPQIVRPQPTPPVDAPVVRAPLPREVVTVPPPPPQLPVIASAPAPAPAAAPPAPAPIVIAATSIAAMPGDSARQRKQELDYFSLVSAHLNRRKTYPVEARKARQQGVVTVRFTVDRAGNVSGTAIKRGSGHDILDQATLALLERVAPLPRMPASMPRDSVTLSLPIDYSLRMN